MVHQIDVFTHFPRIIIPFLFISFIYSLYTGSIYGISLQKVACSTIFTVKHGKQDTCCSVRDHHICCFWLGGTTTPTHCDIVSLISPCVPATCYHTSAMVQMDDGNWQYCFSEWHLYLNVCVCVCVCVCFTNIFESMKFRTYRPKRIGSENCITELKSCPPLQSHASGASKARLHTLMSLYCKSDTAATW